MSERTVNSVKKDLGIEIRERYFSDESARDQLLLTERRKSFDLVVIESVALNLLAEQGVLYELSSIREDVGHHYESRWLSACGNYGIPYAWGTTGILYRKSSFDQPITSWKAILVPDASFKNKVSMYYDSVDLIATALIYLGLNPFTSDKAELKRAYTILLEKKGYLKSQDYVIEHFDDPSFIRSLDLAYGYSGDAYALNELEDADTWDYVVPKEGSTIWLECLVIPEQEEISKDALKVIKYLSQPANAAINSEDAWFATPIPKAKALASKEYSGDEQLFPPKEVIDRSYLYQRIDPEGNRFREQILNRLRDK
nr:spermidine/putrescine ABC transporter substrate-binding protein [Vibrio gelatinilyticus]